MSLSVEGVSVAYSGVPAVDDVSLSLPTGEVLAVLGPSGCGKSTLLRAVAGLEPLAAGRIAWDGADLGSTPTHRRGFALMFQDGQLFESQTVAGNVGYALRIRHRPRAQVAERVTELLALVGLAGYGDRRPATLSGGERQRVALARALAVEPRLILLDEPLSALDASLRERLAADLRSILTAAGTTALLVTHDHEEAFAIADRMALMREGRLVQAGTLSEVWQQPADPEAARFLGYASVLTADSAAAFTRAAGLPSARWLALRRSALVVDPTGPLAGTVLEAGLTPELARLSVDIPGIGRLAAVAGADVPLPRPGERVLLSVEVSRIAFIGAAEKPRGIA